MGMHSPDVSQSFDQVNMTPQSQNTNPWDQNQLHQKVQKQGDLIEFLQKQLCLRNTLISELIEEREEKNGDEVV